METVIYMFIATLLAIGIMYILYKFNNFNFIQIYLIYNITNFLIVVFISVFIISLGFRDADLATKILADFFEKNLPYEIFTGLFLPPLSKFLLDRN